MKKKGFKKAAKLQNLALLGLASSCLSGGALHANQVPGAGYSAPASYPAQQGCGGSAAPNGAQQQGCGSIAYNAGGAGSYRQGIQTGGQGQPYATQGTYATQGAYAPRGYAPAQGNLSTQSYYSTPQGGYPTQGYQTSYGRTTYGPAQGGYESQASYGSPSGGYDNRTYAPQSRSYGQTPGSYESSGFDNQGGLPSNLDGRLATG